MDQFITRTIKIGNMHCKTEKENYSTNVQPESYIKEEIMLPDDTEYSDEEIDIINIDEKNEKSFIEAHKKRNFLGDIGSTGTETGNFDNNSNSIDNCSIKMEVDVSSHEESLLLGASDDSDEIYSPKCTRETRNLAIDRNDINKENMTPNRKEYRKSQKQITIFKFLNRTSVGSSILSPVANKNTKTVVNEDASKATSKTFKYNRGKVNTATLICPKCSKKEKVRWTERNCKDCNELMVYECLTCGDRMTTIGAVYYHIEKKCGRQQRTHQCEQCSYQAKTEYLLRLHMTSKHSPELECPRCGRQFSIKGRAIIHREVCGINVPYLRCKFCPFDTKHKYYLMKHMRSAHKNIKPHEFVHIVKKIIEEGEQIKASALTSAEDAEANKMWRTIDYKQLIQLFCTKCNKIWEEVDHNRERNCRTCGTLTLLQCVKCSKRYAKMAGMYLHLNHKCAARRQFQCAHCDYTSTSKKNLEIHIHRRHTFVAPENYEKCSKCNNRYKLRCDRVNHEKHCGKELLLQCTVCPFKGKNRDYFNMHMQDHKLYPSIDEKKIPLAADVARIKATSPKQMSKKEKLKVDKLTKAFCSKCDKSVKYIKRNKKKCNKCSSKLTYPCRKCGKVFSDFYYFRVHVIRNHLKGELKKRQQCSACGKRFILYENLRLHEDLCLKEPDMQCAHCSFRTKYRGNLTKHLQLIHDRALAANGTKLIVCAHCGKNFGSSNGLRRHKRYYCGKQQSLACDHCNFKAYEKTALIRHLKCVHRRLFVDQELRCKHCGKDSTNIYTHNIHVDNCHFK